MPPVGFEPMILAGERPQSYALDRAATGTGNISGYSVFTTNTVTCTKIIFIYTQESPFIFLCSECIDVSRTHYFKMLYGSLSSFVSLKFNYDKQLFIIFKNSINCQDYIPSMTGV